MKERYKLVQGTYKNYDYTIESRQIDSTEKLYSYYLKTTITIEITDRESIITDLADYYNYYLKEEENREFLIVEILREKTDLNIDNDNLKSIIDTIDK